MTEPRRKCEIIAVGLGFRHRTECLHRNVELEIRMNEWMDEQCAAARRMESVSCRFH